MLSVQCAVYVHRSGVIPALYYLYYCCIILFILLYDQCKDLHLDNNKSNLTTNAPDTIIDRDSHERIRASALLHYYIGVIPVTDYYIIIL